MKNLFLGILATLIALSAGAATTFTPEAGDRPCFIDADGDGICDNAVCVYTDEDGDGICDVCGAYHCYGTAGANGGNFVDADNDGVCDYYEAGQGRGSFVDADNDGICDNYASGRGCGNGYGCGGRRGNGCRGGRGR